MSSSTLLTIPREIRSLIFSHLAPASPQYATIHSDYSEYKLLHEPAIISLMQTNRQLRAEVLDHAEITANAVKVADYNRMTFPRLVNSLPFSLREKATTLYVKESVWLEYATAGNIERMLDRLPGIDTIVLQARNHWCLHDETLRAMPVKGKDSDRSLIDIADHIALGARVAKMCVRNGSNMMLVPTGIKIVVEMKGFYELSHWTEVCGVRIWTQCAMHVVSFARE
jgi:hypothetical protein